MEAYSMDLRRRVVADSDERLCWLSSSFEDPTGRLGFEDRVEKDQ